VIYGLLKENMINKKISIIIVLLLSTFSVSSMNRNIISDKYGNDSITCLQNLTLSREFVKQKSIADAIKPWRKAYISCPKSSKNLYIDGSKIFKYLIKNQNDALVKNHLIDSLMSLYDLRISIFGQEGYVLGLKGADMLKYFPDKIEESFQILKKSVELEGSKSKASALVAYFHSATKKFESGFLEKSDVLEVYSIVSSIIDDNLSKGGKSEKFYLKAFEKIEKLFVPFASCDDLVTMFNEKYNSNKDDLILNKQIVKVLSKKECTSSEVFYLASKMLHKNQQSFLSANSMGKLSLNRSKYSEAVTFYKEALELSENNDQKANSYYGLSASYFKNSNYEKARSYAYKSIELKSWGNPYVLIGDIYAASAKNCGSNAFEYGMVYSAAIDKFLKAKNIDKSLTDLVSKKIAVYSKYLPSNEDAFFSGYEENTIYEVGCWIKETTKVRLK